MPTKQVKILIIEDEEVLLDVLTVKLRREGYQVITAKDGKEGFGKIKEETPDLILLDIIMPKEDGYTVLENMQKDKNLKKIPVIIISNSGQPVEIDRALKLGASDYLIKAQFEPEEVLEKVKNTLQDVNNDSQQTEQTTQKIAIPAKNIPKKQLNKTILIVEDDQFLRELIYRKLNYEGFKVLIATDGQEGYENIIKYQPDLILLDIILPVKDGFEVLQQVKSNSDPKIHSRPIILLSNLGQESDISKGKKLGANDYLIKSSLTTDQIVAKIKKYL